MTDPMTGPRPGDDRRDDADLEAVAAEERLRTDTETDEAGRLRYRKAVEHDRVDKTYPRGIEHADVERQGPDETDSGEILTLEDGSISVPVFEEQLVVTKRLVVRERVVIRKHTVTEEHRVTADLRRERLEIDADEAVADRVADDTGDAGGGG